MDAAQLRLELDRVCQTDVFKARLDELEKESRKLRYRRLPYIEAMEEVAGPIAWGVLTALGIPVSNDPDAQQLWLAVRNDLIRQTRDDQ